MAASSVPPARSPLPLAVVLGLAVVVGVVAVLLAGAAPPPPAAQAGELVVNLPTAVWGLLCLSPLLVGFAAVLARRLSETSLGFPGRAVVSLAVIVALLVLFVVLFHTSGSNGQGSVSISRGGGGGTGNTTPVRTTNNSSRGVNGTSVAGSYSYTISFGVVLAAVVGISALVAVLAIPGALSRLAGRRPGGGPGPAVLRVEILPALQEAGAAIERGEDPRETVVRLYVRLLREIGPRVGDVSFLTADEIRQQALAGLGVSAGASEALTRLFEEARYSTHTIGAADAGRFREAIRQVESDLQRSSAS